MSIPTGFDELYVQVANDYAGMYDSLAGVENKALTSVNRIVDIQNTDYDGHGRQLELLFLHKFNQAYTASRNIKSSTITILDAVRSINNYVISNYAESVTELSSSVEGSEYQESLSDAKLRAFVNESFGSPECPDGWAQLSAEAGYVVDAWETDAE